MRYLKSLLVILLCVVSISALSDSPLPMLGSVSQKLLAGLENLKSKNQLSPNSVAKLVNRDLVPYVAADNIAMAVVGRNYWEKATPEQRNQFINEFRRTIISVYAGAFASYDGDKIKFYPLRNQSGKFAHVKSVIMRKNGQNIGVEYDLIQTPAGWRVVDFSVENISLVNSYRSQFASTLRSSGLSGLIARLKQHNQ